MPNVQMGSRLEKKFARKATLVVQLVMNICRYALRRV